MRVGLKPECISCEDRGSEICALPTGTETITHTVEVSVALFQSLGKGVSQLLAYRPTRRKTLGVAEPTIWNELYEQRRSIKRCVGLHETLRQIQEIQAEEPIRPNQSGEAA